MLFLLVFLGALGHASVVDEDCGPGTSLLQHGHREIRSQSSHRRDASGSSWIPVKAVLDDHGRWCALCDPPPAERTPNQTYVQRSDCGNSSFFLGPSEHNQILKLVPLQDFMRDATEERNATNGYCELNVQKSCADALYNQDYMLYAKSLQIFDDPVYHHRNFSWDWYYCFYNGWLAPELKTLQHDFKGMTAKNDEYCNSDAMVQRGSKGNITMAVVDMYYNPSSPGIPGGHPSKEQALSIAAWACAMGSAACDMTYCAYSYCLKEDGVGTYDECEGWDPVNGMPVGAVPSKESADMAMGAPPARPAWW